MDQEIKQAIDELELLTNAPKRIADLLPHERTLAITIARTALSLNLTDMDLITALPRIIALLVRQIAEAKGML